MPLVRWHRRSSHDGESRPGVLTVRRSRRSRVSVRRRCVAHAPGQGEKRQTCRGRALQQEPAPLRTTRSAGRAASLDGSPTRARSLQTVVRDVGCVGPMGVDRQERRGMNIRLLIWLCLSVMSAMLISPASAQQAGRVALVIGNNNYPDASTPLPSTIRDARALAEELRRSEFDVDLKENVGKADMQRAIDAFTGKIRNGTATLFYFSGYGIQVARQTYLLPVNAQVWTEADVRRDGVSVDALLADMHRKGAKVKIIILDAAQRNPFERRFRPSAEGLAALDAPEGTLALYSVAPGKVIADNAGANSPFVSELIKELRSPNRTAEEVFNLARIGVSRASNNEQVPWVASSLTEEFYFGTSRTAATAPAPAPTPAPAVSPPPSAAPAPAVSAAPPAAPAPAPVSPPVVQPAPQTTATAPATPELGPRSFKSGDTFRDCDDCPELVVLPAGSFDMGSASE